jgi:nicotinate-nucleotide adenylyltransferase
MDRQAAPAFRVALFGGSFDPVHLGHVFLASEARNQLGLDEVIFLPTHCSPFKQGSSPANADHRITMINLAIRGLPWASVSDYEARLGDISYSWRSAEHFRDQLQGSRHGRLQLYWILGSDQWRQLARWQRASYLAELVEFIVFCRDGETPEDSPPFRGHFVEGAYAASSTKIRSQLAAGATVDLPLNPEVLDYITRHCLYCST